MKVYCSMWWAGSEAARQPRPATTTRSSPPCTLARSLTLAFPPKTFRLLASRSIPRSLSELLGASGLVARSPTHSRRGCCVTHCCPRHSRLPSPVTPCPPLSPTPPSTRYHQKQRLSRWKTSGFGQRYRAPAAAWLLLAASRARTAGARPCPWKAACSTRCTRSVPLHCCHHHQQHRTSNSLTLLYRLARQSMPSSVSCLASSSFPSPSSPCAPFRSPASLVSASSSASHSTSSLHSCTSYQHERT
mmetsp:Transcript_14418/g.45343  ORF Transcript_14418/g.45343 Transcript_14418/m.45343 type:complete len:246 (+) Transcript_14418:292-1029(+)